MSLNPYNHYQQVIGLLQHATVGFLLQSFGDDSTIIMCQFPDNIGIMFNFDPQGNLTGISSVRIEEGIPVIDEPEPWEESNDAND